MNAITLVGFLVLNCIKFLIVFTKYDLKNCLINYMTDQ